MLLSSVNLIKNTHSGNNHQFSDFIIGKIKEDQDRKDRKVLGMAPYSSRHGKQRKEEKESKCETTLPHSLTRTECEDQCETTTVTIETSDRYFFTVRPDRDALYLADTESSAQTCVFKQCLFKNDLAVFKTLKDGSKYVCTNEDKKVSLSKFDTRPDPENPDGRFFVIHRVHNGSVFLQPYSHKGHYIHHIDDCLSVRKLEINLRPPEEYFFYITEVEVPEVVLNVMAAQELINNKRNEHVQAERTQQPPRILIPERPVLKPGLFFGCFGVRSKKGRKSEKKSKVYR